MLQRVFLWFISSPSLSWRSEWFLSSQLFFLWSKCPRRWAPGGERKHFWLSLTLPSSVLFEEPVAQEFSNQVGVAWLQKGLQGLGGEPGCPGISVGWGGAAALPPPGGDQSCLCPSLSSLSHSVLSIALFSPMNSMQKIHEQDFSLQRIK